jgi:hypothetical protein
MARKMSHSKVLMALVVMLVASAEGRAYNGESV